MSALPRGALSRRNSSAQIKNSHALDETVDLYPMIWNRGYERQGTQTISVDLVLAGASGHWCVRFCAGRIGDLMRRDRKYVRVQSGRRVCASLHYQRSGLWRPVVFTRRYGLVDAC